MNRRGMHYLLLSFLFVSAIQAKTPIELFEVNTDSLIQAAAEIKDLSATTFLTLLAKSDIVIQQDGTSAETFHYLHLITSAEGTRQLGQHDIIYRIGKDSISIDLARVTSPDGKSIDISSANIQSNLRIKQESDQQLQTENRFMRLIFPGLQVGSRIELQYTVHTYHSPYPGYSSSWLFSGANASMISVASVKYPKSMPLYTKTQHFDGATFTKETETDLQQTWVMKNLSPVSIEPGSPPVMEYISWVKISTYSSWLTLGNSLYRSFWKPEIEEQMSHAELAYFDGLALDTTNQYEAAKKIFYAVQADIRYVGIEVGINTIRPHASQLTCESRFGDCKDMTLLLIRLLHRIGVRAYPAVIATSDVSLRLDTSFADFNVLNHVVAYIPDLNGKEYWLDATMQFSPMDWVPTMLEGSNALILDELRSRIIAIPVTGPEMKLVESQVTTHLDSMGVATVSDKTVYHGYLGSLYYKTIFKYASEHDLKTYMHQFITGGNSSISNITYAISGLGSNDSAFTMTVSFIDSSFAQRAGNLLIVSGSARSDAFDVSGLVTQRKTDVYMRGAPSRKYATTLYLPPGYTIEYRRSDKTMQNPYFDFTYSASLDSANIWTSQSQLMVKVDYVSLANYPEYRSHVEALNAHGRENLVLKRAGN